MVAGGCGAPRDHEFLAPPDAALARIVAFRGGDDPGFTFFAEPGDAPAVLLFASLPAEVLVFSYDQPLGELELEAGPLPPAEGEAACRRLGYRRAFRAQMTRAEERPSWAALTAPAADLDRLLLPDGAAACAPCWRAAASRIGDAPGVAVFATSTGSVATFGYHTGALRRVGQSGRVEEICAGGTEIRAGRAHAGDDLVWAADTQGRLLRLSLSAQVPGTACRYEPVFTSSAAATVVALDVAPSGEPFELFALTSIAEAGQRRLRFSRWDGQRWREAVEAIARDDISKMAALRLGPGRAVAVAETSELLVIEPAAPRLIPIGVPAPPLHVPRMQALAPDGQGGAWIGVGSVGPVRFTLPNRWEAPVTDSRHKNVQAVVPFEDRVFFTFGAGNLGQIVAPAGRCPDPELLWPGGCTTTIVEARAGVRWGRDRILLADYACLDMEGPEIFRAVTLVELERR
jgi:hypothetical protein